MARFVTTYDPRVALDICVRIADGETLKSICEVEKGLPCRQTFYRWVSNYPELSRAYATARELSAYSLEEEALDIAREVQVGEKTSQKVRAMDVAMNQLRWSAGRRNPQVFSERGSVQITVPIQINTNMDMGDGLTNTTKEFPNIYSISATVEEVKEPTSVEMFRDTKPLVEHEDKRKDPFTVAKRRATILRNKRIEHGKERPGDRDEAS